MKFLLPRKRTVILVTNQITFIPFAHMVSMVEDPKYCNLIMGYIQVSQCVYIFDVNEYLQLMLRSQLGTK